MRTHAVALLTAALLVAAPGAAGAQDGPEMDRATDNTTFVDHVPYDLGTDLYFQRRDGRQVLEGETVDTTVDLLFAGADASTASDLDAPSDGAGLHVFDVTDPANIRTLADIGCLGYHADVGVYENYLVQAIDDGASNTGCADGLDPDGVDRAGVGGVRILDVTDPANPVVAGFVGEDELEGSVHNLSIVPDEGLVYVASSDLTPDAPRFAWIDLAADGFPAEVIPMRDISSSAAGGCHDIGLDVENDLAFCAAVEQTFIWDISDPRSPSHVSTIVNPDITIHHGARLAPDGETLVLNDELAGAAAAFGCLGTGSLGGVGALWFYDISDPSSPAPLGSYSTEELNPTDQPCTSHFYNFVPGTTLLTVGWYRSGMVVVDYADPSQPATEAVFEPSNTDFWTSYYYRGTFYGSSFRFDEADEGGGGLWVMEVDGVPAAGPSPYDEGTSWSRWTSQLPAIQPVEEAPAGDDAGGGDGGAAEPSGGTAEGAPADSSLPATGGGIAAAGLLLLAAATTARRRRG